MPAIDNRYALSQLLHVPMDALICGNRKPIMPEPIVIDNARDRRLYTYCKKISEMYDLLTVKIYVAMYGERDGFV